METVDNLVPWKIKGNFTSNLYISSLHENISRVT